MSYNVIPTRKFEKELKRLTKKFPSLKQEFAELIAELEVNPECGTFIGNGCYKIRISIASKNKGKRGGARVVSHFFIHTKSVYLLTIYDKAEQEKLTESELKEMIDSLNLRQK